MGIHRLALVVALLVAGCGDDSGSARADAGGDGGGSDLFNNIPCDYTESMDATNFTPAAAEMSGVMYSGTRKVLCGKFDTGHYGMNGSAPGDVVDADGIKFDVATAGPVIVHLLGSNFTGTERSIVQISKGNTFYGQGVVEGDHGTFIYTLPAGTDYVVGVYTISNAALTSAINYKVLISPDTARCPAKTGAADHAEGADGGANDVVDYNSNANTTSTLSNSSTDAPEASGVTVATGSSYLITGNSEAVNPSDDYQDRDTFLFTTGPDTTQMSIRLNWTSTMADLDFRVYPPSVNDPESIVGAIDISDSEDEYETFSVKPNTMYWLWVALDDSGTAPATYSATLCGETFAP